MIANVTGTSTKEVTDSVTSSPLVGDAVSDLHPYTEIVAIRTARVLAGIMEREWMRTDGFTL